MHLIISLFVTILFIYLSLTLDIRDNIKSKLEIRHLGNFDILFQHELVSTFMYSIYEGTLQIGLDVRTINEWEEYFKNIPNKDTNLKLIEIDFKQAKLLIQNLK